MGLVGRTCFHKAPTPAMTDPSPNASQELRQLIHEESNLRSSALERQAAQLAQLEQRLTSETSARKAESCGS